MPVTVPGARPSRVTNCGSEANVAFPANNTRGAARWRAPLGIASGLLALSWTSRYWIGVAPAGAALSVMASCAAAVKIVPEVLVPKNRMLISCGSACAQ